MRKILSSKCGVRAAGGVLLVALAGAHTPAMAFKKISVSHAEWHGWPHYCQAVSNTNARARGIIKPPELRGPALSERERKLAWKTGIWHYCLGLIQVQRAELSIDPKDAAKQAESGLGDTGYSWNRIPKTEPWAAEMAVTRARAHRLLGEREKAMEYLELARRIRPSYVMTYTVMSLLHFDQEEYDQAEKVLQMGNEATGGKSAELNYFLGLAYMKAGRLDEAKEQADIARSLGYPLDGLARKIAEREKDKSETGAE